MQVRVFSIPTRHANEQSAEELNLFLRGNRIASIEKQFVADGTNSYWSVFVTFVNRPTSSGQPSNRRIDYREVLNDEDFALYVKLRALRKSLAETEGVPAYALFTNEQLAEMVRRKVDSKKALKQIPGIGEARIAKYGESFLGLLERAPGEATTTESKANDAETQ